MLLFFVEYFLALLIALFDNKRNRKIIIFLFALFTFFFAFRNISMNGGTDIDAYRYYYDNLDNTYLISRFAFEPGYFFVNKVFKIFHLPFEALMVSIGIFFCVLFWKAASRFTETPGVCILAALFLLFYYAMGALRQSIAQILIFYALYYLTDPKDRQSAFFVFLDNIKLYYIFVTIAFLFHRTAIILFFIPFLSKKRNRMIMIAGGLVLGSLLPYIEEYFIPMIPYIAGKYRAYRVTETIELGGSSLFSFRLVEYLVIIGILLLIKNKTQEEELALHLLEFGTVLQIFVADYIGATYRFLQFTDLGIIFFVAESYKRMKNTCWKVLYILGIAFIVFYRFYNVVNSNVSLELHYGLIGF